MRLRVWQDAREFYNQTWAVFKHFPYELKRIASQQIASVDSIQQFEEMDALAYKLENGLKKLVESLQIKQTDGSWDDSFIIKESNEIYLTKTD